MTVLVMMYILQYLLSMKYLRQDKFIRAYQQLVTCSIQNNFKNCQSYLKKKTTTNFFLSE